MNWERPGFPDPLRRALREFMMDSSPGIDEETGRVRPEPNVREFKGCKLRGALYGVVSAGQSKIPTKVRLCLRKNVSQAVNRCQLQRSLVYPVRLGGQRSCPTRQQLRFRNGRTGCRDMPLTGWKG
ncbi:hypothetical protein Asppvi_005952 [Aspergillus pseudoviridinutans]|uniref:Uncharacterized protein n=1 Tax=Aspergillus pseudoviridinutans TaxID=1517512 RepID=A0A9P3BA57_9EURO|nr:uncharacterized protein Asppvi_005952 [Aspergillus pseudoviridinutans]GIJ87050.1 hypothetical protein Asppvi_005952 [Aspergillus pseudoviridinutans]